MNLHPPPADPATVADDQPNLLRHDSDKGRKPPLWHGSRGLTGSGSPPRARPLPARDDASTAPGKTMPPELTSAAALLALLFGRQ
ncbi:MAG: hypothetical protein ACO3JG_06750 [Luteolibacter sp.]